MAKIEIDTAVNITSGSVGTFREISLADGEFVQIATKNVERIALQPAVLAGTLQLEASLFSEEDTASWQVLDDDGTDPVELDAICSIEDVFFAQIKITAVGGNADFALLLS